METADFGLILYLSADIFFIDKIIIKQPILAFYKNVVYNTEKGG